MEKSGPDSSQIDTREITLRRSPLAELPRISLLLVLIVAGTLLSVIYPVTIQTVVIPLGSYEFAIVLPLIGLPLLLLAAYIIHRLWDTKYVIGADYVRSIKGLLSLSKEDMRIEYSTVRGIEIVRPLWQRILNVGTLKIGSAMRVEVEVLIEGIFNPSRYRDIILSRMKHIGQSDL